MESIEPKIVQFPEIRVVGVQRYGDSPAEIPALWPVLNSVSSEIKNAATPAVYFGIETYPPDFMTHRHWFYMAAMQVTRTDTIPLQCVAKVIPANQYAVFTLKGKLPGRIGELFQFAYKQWLPKSGYQQAGPYDLERYDSRFIGPENDESIMEVCIPVRR